MITKDIALYRRQLDILRSPGRETLAVGDGGGKSHSLRAGLILACFQNAGAICALVHPSSEELQRDHVEGPTGLKAMLAEAGHEGAVEIRPDAREARFRNGSKLVWVALDKASERRRLIESDRFHLAGVDEAHRVAREQFEMISMKVAAAGGRILAAAPVVTGWLMDRWTEGHTDRLRIETSRADLPAKLQVVAEMPTVSEFLDGLGVPFLMPSSPFREAAHVQKVIDVLQRWFNGEFRRLMILMPTQHGKTMLGVRSMAAYIASCRPYETIGVTSFSDSKAVDRNQDARDFYVKAGGRLSEGSTGKGYWKTPYGGGSWAAGFAGGQSGNPMTWGIVDDPDKDMKESRSPAAIRDKDDWYEYVWLGREAKFADRRLSQMWAATRFWRGDTVGRTLDFHAKRGEAWHLCVLSALFDPAVQDYYANLAPGLFTVEPDWRTEYGEAIDPERFDRAYWEKNRNSSPRVFLSRDQQKPEESDGGVLFHEEWPIDLPVDPAFRSDATEKGTYFRPMRAWDLAATAGAGDWTANVKLGEEKESERIIVRHAARARLGNRDVLRFIAGTMLLDGPDVEICIPEDPAAAGKHQTSRIVDYLRKIGRLMSVRCRRCEGPRCSKCGGGGVNRFRVPKVRKASVREGIAERFEDFADRATPISDDIEGSVDFVAADWSPTIRQQLPWFSQAIEQSKDADWQEELRQIDRLMRQFVGGGDPDLIWVGWQSPYFRELHGFPDAGHDDWVACTAHGWGMLKKPRSVYPS